MHRFLSRAPWVSTITTLALLGSFAACEDAEPDVTPREIAETYIAAVQLCLDDMFVTQVEGADSQALGMNLDVDELEADIQADFDNPYIEVDQDAVRLCLSAIETEGVCGIFSGDGTGPEACEDIISGTLEVGATCDAGECGEGLGCSYGGVDACGTCMALAALGESCTEVACADGLMCDWGSSGMGAVCAEMETPAEVVAPAVGDTCTMETSMDDCGNIAFTGLWCTDGTCAEATVAEVGEACTFPMGGTLCAGSFSEKATCELDMADPSAGGTCVAYPIVGEACDDMCFESFCGEDGVCTAFRAIGEACTYGECGPDADCDGDTMDDMVCTAWDDGEDEDMAMCTEPEVAAGTE